MSERLTRREGRCFWLRQAIDESEMDAPTLAGDTRADVAIVGGGFCGIWIALELKRRQPSLDVAIVEADICGGGSSGRATGQVLPQWLKIAALEAMGGKEAALAFCQASQDVVGEIERFCSEHGIDAEFRYADWLWSATNAQQLGSWSATLDMLEARGLSMMRAVSRDEIMARMDMPGLLGGAIMSGTATLQPAKLVRGLRRVALSLGVRIYENSPMTRLERHGRPIVRTRTGNLAASRVVLALNAWSMRIPSLRSAILVITSDDQISEPVPELIEGLWRRETFQITDSQTFVTGFRTTPDGRLSGGVTGGRLGVGSLDGARFEGRSPRETAMHAFYARANPKLGAARFADSWYGPIDRTRSGLPLFGALPGMPDVFYGYGFSGNGIATSPLAARILASLVLEAKDEWSACPLVRPPESWLPPEPFRTAGSLAVRAAVRRADGLGYRGKRPGLITRAFARMAPGGISTT
ncbi:MAG: FAD-dependent oxidoreductase [Hyphomicrobiaceae bacterium]